MPVILRLKNNFASLSYKLIMMKAIYTQFIFLIIRTYDFVPPLFENHHCINQQKAFMST